MRASALAVCLAALLALPGNSAASVFTGGTGWFWGNPVPQGEDLNAVAFSGSHGVAVGAAGAVLRTDDGGATWSAGASGTAASLREVALPDASTVYAGGGCVLRRSTDGGETFRRVAFSVRETKCPSALSQISFPTPSVGYVVLGNGTVLRTTNGGASFARRSSLQVGSSVPQGGPADVAFTSATTGVVATGWENPAFLRTEDGGRTWTAIRPAGITRVRDIQFINASLGYAVTDNGTTPMAKTEDGGQTWTPLPLTGATGLPRAIACTSAAACAIVAGHVSDGSGDLLTWTSDGGLTGTTIQPGVGLAGLAFASATRVVAVGASGATLASNDAGHSFTRIGSAVPGEFSGLRQVSGQSLIAWVADGTLARSTDGGATWQALGGAPLSRVVDVSFVSDMVGYLLSADGALQRTDDGGASWGVGGLISGARALLATGPDTLLIATRRGVLRSTDGGGTTERVGSSFPSLRGFDVGGLTLFAYGPKALLASGDGGATWHTLRRPRRGSLISVDFVSAKVGYAVRSDKAVFKTTDGGRSWKPVPGVGRDDVVQVSFGDARHGFLLLGTESDLGGVLRTSDGGRSWRPQVLGKRPLVAVTALGAGGGAALSEGLGHLFATTTGGDAGASSALTIRVASKRRVGRRTVVTIAGRLKPAPAGAGVSVTARIGGTWVRKFAKVSHGRFRTSWRLRHGTVFVAQFRGGPGVNAAGTPALAVKVRKPRR
jgi:photosystem II stability/assembly factor-like uncharacterized protein